MSSFTLREVLINIWVVRLSRLEEAPIATVEVTVMNTENDVHLRPLPPGSLFCRRPIDIESDIGHELSGKVSLPGFFTVTY